MPGWLNDPVLFYYHNFYCIFLFYFFDKQELWLVTSMCMWFVNGVSFSSRDIYITVCIHINVISRQKIVSMWSPRSPQGSAEKCAFSLCDVTSLCSPCDHRGGREGSGLCRVPSAPCESGAVLGLSLPQGHDWVFILNLEFSQRESRPWSTVTAAGGGGAETEESPPPQC